MFSYQLHEKCMFDNSGYVLSYNISDTIYVFSDFLRKYINMFRAKRAHSQTFYPITSVFNDPSPLFMAVFFVWFVTMWSFLLHLQRDVMAIVGAEVGSLFPCHLRERSGICKKPSHSLKDRERRCLLAIKRKVAFQTLSTLHALF